MMPLAKATTTTVIPAPRYHDAKRAIAFLCDAFGFERQAVYEGEGGVIEHAQLTFGNGMLMLGSERDTAYGRLMKSPREADADAHYARAKAAGAEIVIELTTQDYGGRDYTARDPEGHIWTFGTYDPWAGS